MISPQTASFNVHITKLDHSVSSDHSAILFNLTVPKPAREKKEIHVRKWKSINISEFDNDISQQITPSSKSIEAYNSVLSQLLDKHAPSVTITVTEHPSTPWYSQEIRHAKTLCRKYERNWRKSRLTVHFELLKSQKHILKSLRDNAKSEYIHVKLNEATSSKDTYSILNHLMHKRNDYPLPMHDDLTELTNNFAPFFEEK